VAQSLLRRKDSHFQGPLTINNPARHRTVNKGQSLTINNPVELQNFQASSIKAYGAVRFCVSFMIILLQTLNVRLCCVFRVCEVKRLRGE
jgi:hypothetical protein